MVEFDFFDLFHDEGACQARPLQLLYYDIYDNLQPFSVSRKLNIYVCEKHQMEPTAMEWFCRSWRDISLITVELTYHAQSISILPIAIGYGLMI